MAQDHGSDLEDCTDDEKDNELLVVEWKRRKNEKVTVRGSDRKSSGVSRRHHEGMVMKCTQNDIIGGWFGKTANQCGVVGANMLNKCVATRDLDEITNQRLGSSASREAKVENILA